MNIEDCESCRWLGYDRLENESVCMLHDERLIDEIESCNADGLTYEQESLVIERRRDT